MTAKMLESIKLIKTGMFLHERTGLYPDSESESRVALKSEIRMYLNIRSKVKHYPWY